MKPRPAHLREWRCALALGLGSGLSPKAPGTAGSLLALLIYWPLADIGLWAWVGIIVLASVIGIELCGWCAHRLGTHDHGAIVWDEFVGMWIAVLPAAGHWPEMLAAFALFRFFDILKPWPIGWLDRRIGGGAGIMLDDIVAGIFAAIILWLLQTTLGG